MTAPTILGRCGGCGYPVRAGDERREIVERGTSAAPEVLLHRTLCRPVRVRRHP